MKNGMIVAIAVAMTAPVAVPAPVSAQGSRYSSACVRDLQKIERVVAATGAMQFAASNDRWLIEVNDLVARLMQRCATADSGAADRYRQATAEAARLRQYCSVQRPAYDCTPWGASNQGDNQRWFGIWKAEVQKALSNSNYSADLGGVAGAAAPSAPPAGAASQCATTPAQTLQQFDRDISAFSTRFPQPAYAAGSRATLQYSYFMGVEGLKILERYRKCMSPADFNANRSALVGMRDKGRDGCIALSSTMGTCEPVYPR